MSEGHLLKGFPETRSLAGSGRELASSVLVSQLRNRTWLEDSRPVDT